MPSLPTSLIVTAVAAALLACQANDATLETTSSGDTSTSVSTDSASARGNAMVRVINVADAVPFASVQLDGVTLFDRIPTASVTEFREVPRSRGRFTAHQSGASDTATLASSNQILMGGSRYSVVLLSENMASRALRVYRDLVMPDSGMARIRVIHAASGGPALDVRAVNGTENLFEGIAFESDAGFKDVQPSSLQLELRARGEPSVLLTTPVMTLARHTATTVVVYGATRLDTFVFVDTAIPAPFR